MKNYTRLILAAVIGMLFATIALAQAASPSDPTATLTASNVVTWLTPVLVPLVIAGVKKFSPSIPSWVLPVIAPVLGVLLAYINQLATAQSANFLLAAALGLAGVGVREVKDQLVPPATS